MSQGLTCLHVSNFLDDDNVSFGEYEPVKGGILLIKAVDIPVACPEIIVLSTFIEGFLKSVFFHPMQWGWF